MNILPDLSVLLIAVSFLITFIRFLKGPRLADRVVAFDVMTIIVVSLLVLLSITYKNPLYLDIAFVFALIGFIGTILFARFNIIRGEDA